MNTLGTYTPLECLLLFQSLVAQGANQDFDIISSHLTNSPVVRDGPTYDAQRLTADALRSQFHFLLRDETVAEEEHRDPESDHLVSKKRKLPTPPLPSVNDAREDGDKLPMLADRLYARYRDYMIRELREEERRYARLQREIEKIEKGEWDETFLEEDKLLSNGISSTAGEQAQSNLNGTPAAHQRHGDHIDTDASTASKTASEPSLSPTTSQVRSRPGVVIKDSINRVTPPITSPRPPEQSHGKSQTYVAAPSNQTSSSNVQYGPPPPNGPHHPGPLKWEPPFTAANQMATYPPYSPYHPQQHHAQQYPQPQRGSFSTSNTPTSQSSVPSSSGHPQSQHPVLLPPPMSGVRRPPSSPAMPLDALADAAGQQHRAPSGSPMLPQQLPPPSQSYAQQYPPQQRPLSASGPPAQWSQQPHATTFHPPQLQGTPNQQASFPPQAAVPQSESRHYNSPYNPSHGLRPSMPQTQAHRLQSSLPSTPTTRGSPYTFTGSGTKWTPTPTGATPGPYHSVPKPAMEPLSPVLQTANSAVLEKKKPGRKPKTPKAPPRGTQRTRAGSTASSAIAGTRRSQSIMSHVDADELSMDNEPTPKRVKEEVDTPVGVSDTGDTTADESATLRRPVSRARPSSTKRKRASSNAMDNQVSSTLVTHVLWTKNFPNISKSALENISADKNANMFSVPVKERDAPGYKSLILRPQDLKSIKTAITTGHRAATAAAPEDMNPNAPNAWLPISEDLIPPKGIINNTQFEKELMRMFANAIMFNPDPDRGFGKQWQAIGKAKGDVLGYAFDEDSVVKSTKAMFADVEKIVAEMRAAERRSEETSETSVARAPEDDEVDELAGDTESNVGVATGSVGKRRRKA